MKDRVAIIMPAMNEGAVIGKVIRGIRTALRNNHIDGKIIVVNDGSTDDTASEAKKAGAKVITHLLASGSPSMPTLTGVHYAKTNDFDMVVTADSDGQHDPDDIINGINILIKNKIDFLVGNRLSDKSGMSKTKLIGNKGLSFGTKVLFGTKISDSQSGLRILSRNAIEKLSWKTAGYEFCSESIWRAKQAKLKLDEYPIRAIYNDHSRSTGQNNWNGPNIVKALIRQRITEIFE